MMMVCGPGWGPGGKGVMTGEVTSERDRGTKHTHFQKQGRLEKEKTGGGGRCIKNFIAKMINLRCLLKWKCQAHR